MTHEPLTVRKTMDTTLAVEGITVELSGRTILDDVSFTIGRGEFTGLIGANGAGKTTLFRVILGLQAPTRGRIRVGSGERSRRDMGYVPQKFLLDPDMPLRGRDLVGLGLDGHRLGFALPSRARRRRVD
ncbi:MAG: ATP-binding cassette domain-containing protein, partial [Solirubrobacteraceae bacterium]